MSAEPLHPATVAGADQELAACSEALDTLIAAWRAAQPLYDAVDLDTLERIGLFALSTVVSTQYPAAVIAIAVRRLAANDRTRDYQGGDQ